MGKLVNEIPTVFNKYRVPNGHADALKKSIFTDIQITAAFKYVEAGLPGGRLNFCVRGPV